jgi:predicted amidohydrolase YtcJ
MLADFTVLDGDPFETPAEKLGQLSVLAAYLDGEPVYTVE